MAEGSKKGYSIWSLLMIMALLAVWLAVPRHSAHSTLVNTSNACFFLCHQLGLWIPLAMLAWLLSGKRRSVLYVATLAIIVVWGPLLFMVVESAARATGEHRIVQSVLLYLNVYEGYGLLYAWLYTVFGYGPARD